MLLLCLPPTNSRDIACRNALLTNGLTAAICDFGLSLQLPEGQDEAVSPDFRTEHIPVLISAPEALSKGKFSRKTDSYM